MNQYSMDITYWPPAKGDGFGGRVFSAPTVFKGRWEDRQESFITPEREMSQSLAIVYLPSYVSDSVQIGGYLCNGISTATDPTDKTKVTGAYEIRQMMKIPDLRNVKTQVQAIL